jgi:hypothetical protein
LRIAIIETMRRCVAQAIAKPARCPIFSHTTASRMNTGQVATMRPLFHSAWG